MQPAPNLPLQKSKNLHWKRRRFRSVSHMSDDVPTAPEQNGCATDPKHWNKNRRHMSFLWMLTLEKFRPAKGRSGVRNAALNKNLREPRN
jgi:hypothetical protein